MQRECACVCMCACGGAYIETDMAYITDVWLLRNITPSRRQNEVSVGAVKKQEGQSFSIR